VKFNEIFALKAKRAIQWIARFWFKDVGAQTLFRESNYQDGFEIDLV